MAETPCFFGLTNVRVGTRMVALVHFWFRFFCASLLIIEYVFEWRIRVIKYSDTDNQPSDYEELEFDVSWYSQLSGTILIMWSCYYLLKSTYLHNLHYIKFWIVLCAFNIVTSVVTVICASFRMHRYRILCTGLVGCLLETYTLYVVYQFYMDELSLDMLNSQNSITT